MESRYRDHEDALRRIEAMRLRQRCTLLGLYALLVVALAIPLLILGV